MYMCTCTVLVFYWYFRSRTALQATFSIPSLVSDHMEIIPKYGLVQGGSSFTAQLKFLPRPSLLTEESSELFEGGTLKVPINILVAGQVSIKMKEYMYLICVCVHHV